MPRQRFDLEKDRHWRKILLAWQQSGLGVTHFCRREDIKLSSFCDWRRRIQKRDSELRKKSQEKTVSATSPRKTLTPENFAPVVLTGPALNEIKAEPVLEIHLRSGVTISIRESCSATLLATAIKILETSHV